MNVGNVGQLSAKPNNYYQNHSDRREIEPFIPQNCRRILDVGCGLGLFGALLKSLRSVEVWGIELDPHAASKASERLDRVLTGDLAQHLDSLHDNFYDCVVFNDVLEHLVDPWEALRIVKPKLSTDGSVVASIPNVRYFYLLKEILFEKQWRYRDYGILDRTHLRFFTQDSMAELFDSCGYETVGTSGINGFNSWKFDVLNFLFFGHMSDMRYQQIVSVVKPRR